VYDLAGKVSVVPATGGAVEVTVVRGGRDAAKLSVVQKEDAGRKYLSVVYPSDHVVYPPLGFGSRTETRVDDNGRFGGSDKDFAGISRHRVQISGGGGGLEAHADLRIAIPAGQKFSVYLGVGRADVANVSGEILVDVCSADIGANGTRGKLVLDTGSGSIQVHDAQGELSFDTGSGDVDVTRTRAGLLHVDTGSGAITGKELSAERIAMDTGSGDIEISGVNSTDINLDTGSGAVRLLLTSDVESLHVDTGSGDVIVRIPSTLGAEISLETGSGELDLDVPLQLVHRDQGELSGKIGDGRGRMRLETGSGSIRLASNQ
jgi:lia operon protein LiaG